MAACGIDLAERNQINQVWAGTTQKLTLGSGRTETGIGPGFVKTPQRLALKDLLQSPPREAMGSHKVSYRTVAELTAFIKIFAD
jgi:hypothetical protein